MKKKYEKPEIYFENFSICTNIAAGCEHTNVTATEDVHGCGYRLGRLDSEVVFTSSIGCNRHELVDGEGGYQGICYHVPSESNNLFTS